MNLTEQLVQRCDRVLQIDSQRVAVTFEGQRYPWRDMKRVADKLATAIADSTDTPVPVVAFVARNRPSALAAFLGLLRARCVIRMVYPFQSAEAIAAELTRIAPQVVVAASEDFAEPVCVALQHLQAAAVGLTDMDAECVPGFEKSAVPGDKSATPQVILLTSGTTGPPKTFALGYDTVAAHYTGSGSNELVDEHATPALLYFPVSNISGLYATLPPLISATPIVLLDRFKLDLWLDFVRQHRPAQFGMPPAGYKMLLDADVPVEDLAGIKAMGAGAAPLDPEVQASFEARYGIPILLSYGATEFGGPVTRMTLDDRQQFGDRTLGSVGRVMTGMQVRVVDAESGAIKPVGEDGLLEVVSSRIGPEWIRTSDIGCLDNEGFLFLKGRADGAIIRGGFKLVPTTIEKGLLRNEKIAMAAVVGISDARLGQVPVAAVVLKDSVEPISDTELAAELRKHVPSTHIPTQWQVVAELPRTPSMKVDVPAVKRLFERQTENT